VRTDTARFVSSPFNSTRHLKRAAQARLLIAISFHFVKGRLTYLDKALQSLAAFPISRRDIVVFTNTTNITEQESIRELFCRAGLVDGHDARLAVEAALTHPFNLTWAHKKLISGDFLAPDSLYTHFVYIEDDMQLTYENFVYFLVARDLLRPFNDLVPSFLRTEWSAERQCLVNPDATRAVSLARRPFISHDGYAFVNLDVPYCAGFILDRDLARKYVKSRSFDFKRSCEVSPYGLRERAAMGLMFEDPPAPFTCRCAVPVSMLTRVVPQCAWLAHLPNTYADIPNLPHRFGTMAITDLFADDFNAKNEVTLLSFKTRIVLLLLFGWGYRRLPRDKRVVLKKVLFECYGSTQRRNSGSLLPRSE
jgi:hypothetical protein